MQKNNPPHSLVCHHCGTENPLTAYCCLNCFKVLRPKENIPFWKIYIRPNASVLFLFMLAAGIGIYAFKRWMDNIEAQVTMNFRSAEYNLSVVADKKKKLGFFGIETKSAETQNSLETPQ